MKLLTKTLSFIFIAAFCSSCHTSNSKERTISNKNECYDLKLLNLKESSLYKDVMTAFTDTFLVLKTKKEYFGIPEVINNQIDKAIFFNADSSECMLIVLQKPLLTGFVFGQARMIRGVKEATTWKFKVSLDYSFSKDYFSLYQDNSFENISKLARYNVLTDGNYNRKGCDIDEEYWFAELKR